jgi:hypothetical protein
MTFEELLKTAAEQDERIFRFEASLSFATFPSFTKDHFRALNMSYINNASWELIKKNNFPFEHIITTVDFVYTVGGNINGINTIKGITIKFSVTILNQPSATVDEFAILIRDYFNGFGEFLIKMFKIPMDLKGSEFILDLPKSHKIYKDLINNAL